MPYTRVDPTRRRNSSMFDLTFLRVRRWGHRDDALPPSTRTPFLGDAALD
jgi:hypothetical protein